MGEDIEAHIEGKGLSWEGDSTTGKSPFQNHTILGLDPGSAISSSVTLSKSFAFFVLLFPLMSAPQGCHEDQRT